MSENEHISDETLTEWKEIAEKGKKWLVLGDIALALIAEVRRLRDRVKKLEKIREAQYRALFVTPWDAIRCCSCRGIGIVHDEECDDCAGSGVAP